MSDRYVTPARVMNKKVPEADWLSNNPLLLNGEFACSNVGGGRTRIKIGDGVTRFADLPYIDESAGAFGGVATTSSVPNTSSGSTWYFAGPGTYTNYRDINNIPLTVTGNLAILAFKNGVWTSLEIFSPTQYVETRYRVNATGSIPSTCDYTDLDTAYNAVTGSNINNRFVLEIAPGTYNVSGVNAKGLELTKDYVDLIGYRSSVATTGEVVIKGVQATTAGAEPGFASIFLSARCSVKNVRIVGYRNFACIYQNIVADRYRETILENVRLHHFGGQGTEFHAFYSILYYGQISTLKNVISQGGDISLNNQNALTNRNNNYGYTYNLTGCRGDVLVHNDYLQYSRDIINLIGNEFREFKHLVDLTLYNASSGNVLINRGFLPNVTPVTNHNNRIGLITINTDYTTVTKLKSKAFAGYNRLFTNATAGDLFQGQPVQKLVTAGLPNAYTAGDILIGTEKYILWTGTGPVDGFVEDSIINTGKNGFVRPRVYKGTYVKASCFNSNGTVVYGDELEMNGGLSAVLKRSAGALLGYVRGLALDGSGNGYVWFEYA